MSEEKLMTVGKVKDESMYEYFINKEKEFVADIISTAHCLETEALKDPVDHNEIIDLFSRSLSEAYIIRDLAKDKYL